MSKFRESLVDRMIRIYGFENPIVISFCEMCESWKEDEYHNKSLAVLVKSHEEMPVMD